MVAQVVKPIIPDTVQSIQAALERQRQAYAHLLAENTALHDENLGLRVLVMRAKLDVPESLSELAERAALEHKEAEALATPVLQAPAPDRADLQEDLEVLQLNYTTARENLRRAEDKREELESDREYQRRVWAIDNQVLNGGQKVVFLAVRAYIFSLWHSSNALGEHVRVPMAAIAQATGLSTDTVGSAVRRLHKVGLVDRQERPAPKTKDGGPPQTHIYVALTLLAYNPESIPPETPKLNHGGDTRFCKVCGSIHLVRKKRIEIVCKDCGSLQEPPEETEEPVNPPDPFENLGELESPLSDREELRQVAPDREQLSEDREPEVLHEVAPVSTIVPVAAVVLTPGPVPQSICYLCLSAYKRRASSWSWQVDEGESGEYCCTHCYSPFAWSERERLRQEKEEDICTTPF